MSRRDRCLCGHASYNHVNGHGLCLRCPGIGCLAFRTLYGGGAS